MIVKLRPMRFTGTIGMSYGNDGDLGSSPGREYDDSDQNPSDGDDYEESEDGSDQVGRDAWADIDFDRGFDCYHY